MNLSRNLFTYATSELSQDAFICWLLSHLYTENKGIDEALENCAIEFVKCFLPDFTGKYEKFSIKRQYNKIDVLININDKRIIIEDKTFTDSHDDQVNVYKNSLMAEGVPEKDIICVFYKIIEQPHPEKNVDFEFTREILLKIFNKYRTQTSNSIFTDYYDYLSSIDEEVKDYYNKDIKEWNHKAYVGFFTMLQKTLLRQRANNWSHVNNQAGGFSCLWWVKSEWGKMLKKSSLFENGVEELYPQFEDHIIAIKMIANKESSEANEIRWKLYDYFSEVLPGFRKKKFNPGKHMTVGYIEYDYKNYELVVDQVEKAIDAVLVKNIWFRRG